MIPYVFMIFTAAGFSFLELTNTRKNFFLKYGFFLFLLIFVGLRIGVGDTVTYYAIFNEIHPWEGLEKGFLFFQYLVKIIYDDPYIFIFIFSFLSILIKFIAFQRISPLPYISLLFYVGTYLIVQDMNQIRQGFAAGICLLSLPYIVQRKFIPFLLVFLVAFYFHVSAIVFLLAYFIYKINLKKRHFIFLIGFGLFCFFFLDFSAIIQILFKILYLSKLGLLYQKVMFYIHMEKPKGFFFGSLFLFFYAFLFWSYKKKINSKMFNGFLNLYILGMLLNLLGMIAPIFDRVSWYFVFIAAILYAYVLHFEKNIYNRIFLISILILIMVLKVVKFSQSQDGMYVYDNFLFQ